MEFEDVERVNENGDLNFKAESKKEAYNQLKQKLRYLTYVSEYFLHVSIILIKFFFYSKSGE